MAKTSFSHKIDERFATLFEELYNDLGPPKYRILEAAIEAFSALPREVQYRLKAQNEKDRQLCLDLLRAMRADQQPKKRAHRA